MAEFDYDMFVIGIGSGGVRAARFAANFGAKVAAAEEDQLGDVTTLADPSVVPLLIAKVKQAQGRA